MDDSENLADIETSFAVGRITTEDAKSKPSVDVLLDHFPDYALTIGFSVEKARSGATFVDGPLDQPPDTIFTVGLPVEEVGVVPHPWMPPWVILSTLFSPAYFS
ncbi:hypothetical protein LIER_16985 [Lithospermum erythrorhizon]|uniref:Uncharacterized protein n=1 Tax=Lithospermum erythrorhizon TaxID=34254 RepID=A0AAV3QA49_LITER